LFIHHIFLKFDIFRNRLTNVEAVLLKRRIMRKYLTLVLFTFFGVMCSAQGRGPAGLADDMLATNERLHLPAAVIAFEYEKDDLDVTALRQLEAVAAMIAAASDDARFYIIATADAEKASQRHNLKLSTSRCDAIASVLTKSHEVNPSRLVSIPAGGLDENPRQQARQMAIVILCTPDTRDVVERWYANY
jgi:hypothetical protein